MKKLNKVVVIAILALATVTVFAQPTKRFSDFTVPRDEVTYPNPDDDFFFGNLVSSYTLSADTTYILDVIAFVVDGQTLTIEPGTVIKAEQGNPGEANSVVVTRGGKIMADGTKEKPIVFTTVEDPLDGSYAAINRAKWGGIIILGKAYNNILFGDANPDNPSFPLGVSDGEGYIEGLNPPDPRNRYGAETRDGGSNPQGNPDFVNDDNSGVLRYVSVRHGGSKLGENNEINGITLGSVGSKTILEHVEVVSNEDDGIEFFGGTVNIKYANVMFCEDDYIDVDQGYNGKGQFIYCVQLPVTTGDSITTLGDNGFEWDGNDFEGREIPSNPHFTNVTIIGYAGSGDYGLELKEDMAGIVSNGIVSGFDRAGRHKNDNSVDTTLVESVLFLNIGEGNLNRFDAARLSNEDLQSSSSIIDDQLTISTSLSGGIWVQSVVDQLNPVPAAGETAVTTDYAPWLEDSFFDYAPYRGAFAPGTAPWTSWTNHTSMGTDAGAIGCPTDVDGSGATGIGDIIDVLGSFGDSCE